MKQKLLKWLMPKILPHIRYWGVEYESKLPPEFIITHHAEQRLKERFKCNPVKTKKIVMKAFKSKVPINIPNDQGKIYRHFNGHTFVFDKQYRRQLLDYQKILITVYNHKAVYEK